MTSVIKGVAIVFMILLHTFGGEGWYDNCIPMNQNLRLVEFMSTFKICVPIYVFLVGYGYAFSIEKDIKYSVRHIKKLLLPFWIVLFCFAIPVGYSHIGSSTELIKNMFGISSSLCWASWFVYFYIYAMVVMPFIGRLIDKGPVTWSVIMIVISFVLLFAVHHFTEFSSNDWLQALFNCLLETPLMIVGYYCASTRLYEKVSFPKRWYIPVISIITFAGIVIGRHWFNSADVVFRLIYIPIFIFSVLVLFSNYRTSIFFKILAELGEKSVYMWFFHILFFTAATRSFFQRFITISDNLWIIALLTILLSYFCSAIIKKVVEY